MKVTRLGQNRIQETLKKGKRPYRRHNMHVSESELVKVTDTTNPLNIPNIFTYADTTRNSGAIGMFKHQIDQLLTNYGVDLAYFRKFNTFLKEGEENKANMIYGEDTTAQYYVSGMIRAFVSVDNMAWNFNQLGLESVEQINIYIAIERFEQAFAKDVGEIETRHVEFHVSGNLVNYEVTGKLEEPEFDAFSYSTFDDKLHIESTSLKLVPKGVNTSFYQPRNYNSNTYDLSGSLKGKLKQDQEHPLIVYGFLEGDISFHSLKNKEGSETWGIAPQVGDYFAFNTPTGLSEEWEINQVYDRNLTKSGINPLLGKYIYQVVATKRVESHEQSTPEIDVKDPGEDIEEIFGKISEPPKKHYADNYTYKSNKNIKNEQTNALAKNAFDYVDRSDVIYGGVQNQPKAK